MKFVLVADTFPPLRTSGAIQLRVYPVELQGKYAFSYVGAVSRLECS